MDPDMALGRQTSLDVTMALGGKQVAHISLYFTTITFSNLPLSTGHEPF